jgi:hypothetical protein
MRDLILLDLVHLRIPMAVRYQVQRNCWFGTYVTPLTSNIGSQPGGSKWGSQDEGKRNYQKREGLSEVLSCPRSHQQVQISVLEGETYICTALEDDWFVTWTFTVCKCAYRLSRFVRKSSQHVIKSLQSKRL